tara:strand:- start:283 stop:537 length:255 start_codon:yes stop_codon:yes gene_type:complete
MKTIYLTTEQITDMAESALKCYEMTASWKAAGTAAAEHAADEFGVKATSAQIATAMQCAKVGWSAIVFATKKAIASETEMEEVA